VDVVEDAENQLYREGDKSRGVGSWYIPMKVGHVENNLVQEA